MKRPNELLTDFFRECDSNGATLIAETELMKCSDCGEGAELRPYGKDGAWVCFNCGMKDEETAQIHFTAHLNGAKHKAGNA